MECYCFSAQMAADKIIQHELLVSWIIARFHGYSPTEYGALSEWRGERQLWCSDENSQEHGETLHSWLSDGCYRAAAAPEWQH